MKIIKLATLLVTPVLFACGPKLTLDGTGVRLADEVAPECTKISAVEATGSCEKAAEVLLRNKAGAMKANVVVVEDKAEANGEHRFKGNAYDCKP